MGFGPHSEIQLLRAYTSHPTALEFSQEYDDAAFATAARRYPERPLSPYVHIPFCHKLCYFCGCNKIVTRHGAKVDDYLDMLAREIRARAPLFAGRHVSQIHWGGGTPTFLSVAQTARLMALLREHFSFTADAELSIEIDPRDIPLNLIDDLQRQGFNRISVGVQDFNGEVQRLINREQDEALIFDLIERATRLGFRSTNIDLIGYVCVKCCTSNKPRHYQGRRRILERHKILINPLILLKDVWGLLDVQHLTPTYIAI